ncbi:MAG: SDR family NAD(P)-dependent oxidoreductase [Nocardioidaceae bacterium]|nr:SDR family NAD(P)-dependent oxidoreductase [Nocardioidaceae bacterium]
MLGFGSLLDTAMDRTVLPGFSRVGYAVRRRLPGWPADPEPGSMAGEVALVTGATSGLGLATAQGLAALGARVHLVVRDTDKANRVAEEIRSAVPAADLVVRRCDVADLDDVRRFGDELADDVDGVDVLVHNAGALPPRRTESPQGHELTMALHVLGPVLMTEQMLPLLAGRDARVIMVTSGGMYTQALRDDDPEYLVGTYAGATAYARSKRAQVELLGLLGDRWSDRGVSVYATHPGWADTPGVSDSLPTFRKVTGPILRDAEGGADTTVWLSAVRPAPDGGGLWHDRRQRPTHFRSATRPTSEQVARMWAWVVAQTGLSPSEG